MKNNTNVDAAHANELHNTVAEKHSANLQKKSGLTFRRKPKKNPKADLNKNRSLYFSIGLLAVLISTWSFLEIKSYDKVAFLEKEIVLVDDTIEIPQVIEFKTPPPPKPPVVPAEVKTIDDLDDTPETLLAPTETTQEEEILPDDVEEIEKIIDVIVPFFALEDVPVFPGCENVSKRERKKCFEEKIMKHIKKNIRYPEEAQEIGAQGRVAVTFTIDKTGNITNIRKRGPDKSLESEAVRIIGKLPKMIPGKQQGKPVKVSFSVPITFRLSN